MLTKPVEMRVVSAAHYPTNLPRPSTSFVGRASELAELQRLLESARLVTLTGPGGSGKTRLALQAAAASLPAFVDGVWWCDLAAVADPAYIPQTVATSLGFGNPANRPPLDALIEALRDRRLLLVLDNCEHVLAACAALAQALLDTCPHVRLLATSLQPLGLAQERVWPTPPLALPAAHSRPASPDALLRCDAARLFAERARDTLPEFALDARDAAAVATICRRLDGLPLALELAAARVRLLTVEQIAERLDDAFRLLTRGTPAHSPRHQALRATMDWTYQFLTAPEQVLLMRLSVFAGTFTLEMIEVVCTESNIEDEKSRISGSDPQASSLKPPQAPSSRSQASIYSQIWSINPSWCRCRAMAGAPRATICWSRCGSTHARSWRSRARRRRSARTCWSGPSRSPSRPSPDSPDRSRPPGWRGSTPSRTICAPR
jgi:hypothetical protein